MKSPRAQISCANNRSCVEHRIFNYHSYNREYIIQCSLQLMHEFMTFTQTDISHIIYTSSKGQTQTAAIWLTSLPVD